MTLGLSANLLGIPLLNLSGTVGTAVAPAGGGTSSSGLLDVGAVLGAGLGVTAGGSVTDVTATRSATQSSARAEIAGVNVGLLGITAVQTDAVFAQATCPVGGTPTATAAVTNLRLLGQAVTLNATTPTVSLSTGVNVAGLVGARVAATAQQITTTTATGATASAVVVSLTLTATIGLPTTLNLGTIQLASANCTAPNASATNLAPTSGPTRGGTAVTITGAGLQNTTGVTFGGVPAASFTPSADGTTVTAVAPASETAGAVPVTLVRPTGNLTPGNFTYIAPTITAVAPPQGSTAGGTTVTLTGTGLLGATGVTFGGTPGTLVGTPTETSITVTTPARTAGTVPVVAVLPGLDATIAGGFTFVTPTAPTIASYTPTQGPAGGGTTVTFTGTNLANVSAVTFGGSAATIVGTPTATSLTVTTPAHAVGAVPVVLTNPGGSTTAATPFTYLDDGSGSTFTGVTPTTVPTSGGTTITIAGTGLAGATGVTVGGVVATNVIATATSVTATVPVSETAGPATVSVQFPAGTRTAGTVTYQEPTITAVTPATGPTSGGTTLTLTGTGLAPVTAVTVGGTPATIVGTPTATTITVTTAAHAAGLVDVVAVLPGADATAAGAFTYLDDGTGATITGVAPATSPTSGGSTITVSGTGLGGATALTVGGVAVSDLVVAPDGTTVSGTIPASNTAGSAAVQLTFPAGTVAAGSIVYVAPAITDVTPSQGPDDGGTDVTLTGTGFTGATALLVDGTSVPFTVDSDTSISFTTPAHAAGPVDLTVVLPGLDATAPGGFAYLLDGVAVVDAITPDEGPTSGGTTVTITGENLSTVTEVLFDGVPATIVGTPTATSLTVTSPAHPEPGPVTLTLTNEGGDSWVPGGFTYLADGTGVDVTDIDPAQVPTAGGITVTLTGTGFSGATGITVGGQAAGDVVVAADGSSITFTAPPTEDPGAAPIVIEFPLGTAAAGDLTYIAPTLDDIDPAQGPISGGTTVTLTGTGLERATGVTFAGTPATDLTVVGPGVITVSTPPLPAGTVDVVVQLPGADATATDAFEYLDDGSEADVTDVSPATLPTSGGTVTITGTGLGAATSVTVGGIELTDLDVSDTVISGVLPPSEVDGAQPVVIVFPAGTVDAGQITLVAPELTTVSPTFGISSGGNTLTLTGTGLTGVTEVLVGGTPATVLTATDTEITVTAPAHVPGVVDIAVILPGVDAVLTAAYTYLDDGTGATVTGIAPTDVPTSGGVQVTVTGTGFDNVFGVTVGGVLADDPQVSADGTTVTLLVPAAEAAGPATVTLWFPAGTVVAGQITYVGPTVTAVDPAQGPTSGGTIVTLTGTGLGTATGVLVDGQPADVQDVTDTTVVITTPAGIAGPADIVVTLPGADATVTDGFTYLEDGSGVEVTDLSPTTSPTAGGGTLTLTGTGLAAVTGVTIGGVEAEDLTVNGDGTQLTVTIPASEAAGDAPVVLILPAGTEDAGSIEYLAPTVADLDPIEGPAAGDTTVTVTGTGFTGATGATLGGAAVLGFTVVSDTEITFTTPAHAPGAVELVIALPGADATLADAFTYLDDGSGADITDVTPGTSPTSGGGTLTITGTGLAGATGVSVGGVEAEDFTVNGDGTVLTVTIPASDTAGPAPIVIAFPAGEVDAGELVYVAPELTGIDPAQGPTAGGTEVTLTGTGLSAATAVTFGGVAGVDLTVVSDTEITVLTPSHPAGPVDVVIQLPGADATVTDGYEYLDDGTGVVAEGIDPGTSPVAGGGTLTITGTGLDAVTTVTIGGVEATDLTVNGDGTELTVTIPASEVTGQVPVTLTTPDGDVLAGGLTYVGSTATEVDPVEGPISGGTSVTVTGTDLGAVTAVEVDGLAAADVVATDTTVTFTTPAHAVGPVTVVLIQPGLDVTLTDAFTYLDDGSLATVDGIDPDTVPLAGGTTVTITGTGLENATGVTVDGVPAEDVVVAEDGTTITFTAPPGTYPGAVPVVVTFPAGEVAAGDLTYEDDGSQATVDGIDPDTAPLAGGITVTITGTGLGNATGVTVDGVDATDVVVSDDGTEITFTVPPGTAPGIVPVVVVFPAGEVAAGDLTYEDDGSQATVDGIDPDTVPLAGGTTVTITGTGLENATGVTVGGVAAEDVAVSEDGTTITFTAPPGTAPGVEPVVVIFPAGEVAAGDLTYEDDGSRATIGGIDPDTVPLAGGITVTITGTGLGNATGVTVDGVPAEDVVVSEDGTTITFTAPPGTDPGAVPVVVTFPAGEVAAGDLTYEDDGAGAVVDGIDPDTVPLAGGTTVTITGTGLENATGITVGGVEAEDVVVSEDGTTITFTAPPGTEPGSVPVVIVFPGGQVPAGDLTYEDDGSLATFGSITPALVPTYGGTEVTITGTGLQNVTGATVNDQPATDVQASEDGTTVTLAVPPSEIGGPVDVELTFPAGTRSAGQLTYEQPAIYTVDPPQGPDDGGTEVTIVGGNLGPATQVLFDGVPGTDLVVQPALGRAIATTLTVTAPPQEPGLVDITVVLPGDDAELADGYGYLADDGPTIEAIDPAQGPTAGGTEVTLTGTGLDTLTEVTFDGLPATIVSTSPSTAVVTTPAHPEGPVDVAFTNADGTTVLPGAFTYTDGTTPGGGEDPLTVTGYTPRVGPTSGGQTVTITGTGFLPGDTVVTFDGIPGTVTVLDGETLLVITPPHEAGVVPLVVIAGTQESAPLRYQYTADATLPGPPVVTGANPDTIPTGGGITVTIGGSGFIPGQTSVYLCGVLIGVDQVTVAPDGTALTFIAPPCAAGPQTATVITPGGTSSLTLTYVNGLSPWRLATTGSQTGGTPWVALLLVAAGAGLLLTRRTVVLRRNRSAVPPR
ncbi:IPT/TIG domain-containing protein [Cellulomonas sp. NPDC089187]|uniref:IPT/TIG domain-containing protein n=1 Tax=Cellulomonas sp. NPDC089187 TaxID=3154970 RepID=UPI0034264957